MQKPNYSPRYLLPFERRSRRTQDILPAMALLLSLFVSLFDTEAWQSQHTVRGMIFLCLGRRVYCHLHNKILTQITDGEEALMLPHVGSMM